MRTAKKLLIIITVLFIFCPCGCQTNSAAEKKVSDNPAEISGRWSQEKAWAWYEKQSWPVGCNFIPSTAINQLEMWQADTFDAATIDRELSWAQQLGFNSMRVFLHDLAWKQDSKGLIKRMEKFLEIANSHNINIMFVLLDSCWDPHPQIGKQHEPKPHVHNSGWLQSPHIDLLKDPSRHDELKGYVQGVIKHFRNDKRILIWYIYNEPGNTNGSSYGQFEPQNKSALQLQLLQKALQWARDAKPSQPLTVGVWAWVWGKDEKKPALNEFSLANSDIITFHSDSPPEEIKRLVGILKEYNRPIICSEYMIRPGNSKFQTLLPFFKEQKIGAYNWGLVAGKTQTQYPWESWQKTYTE